MAQKVEVDWSTSLGGTMIVTCPKKVSCDLKKIFCYNLQKILVDAGKKQIKLAFSIMAHNELPLLEVLLSTIFRPYHSYCIFVDAKAPSEFLR